MPLEHQQNTPLVERYEQAQTLLHGIVPNHLVLNDVVLPHWIQLSDGSCSHCFWYQRASAEGKEYRLVDAKAANNQPAFNHQTLADTLALASNQWTRANWNASKT